MSDKLIKLEQNELVSIIDNKGVTDLIKPLIKEIYLFDTFVSGTNDLEDEKVLKEVKVGDQLILRRENNKFDKNAILILTKNEEKLGYIPRKDNLIFSRLLEAGKRLTAKIKEINTKGDFSILKIDIYLIDF